MRALVSARAALATLALVAGARWLGGHRTADLAAVAVCAFFCAFCWRRIVDLDRAAARRRRYLGAGRAAR